MKLPQKGAVQNIILTILFYPEHHMGTAGADPAWKKSHSFDLHLTYFLAKRSLTVMSIEGCPPGARGKNDGLLLCLRRILQHRHPGVTVHVPREAWPGT